MLEPEAFFPVAKDATLVRATQLAVLELLGTLRNRTDEGGRRLEVARGLGRAREQ